MYMNDGNPKKKNRLFLWWRKAARMIRTFRSITNLSAMQQRMAKWICTAFPDSSMAYHPKQNGVVELQSLNFPKRAQFFVSAVPEEKQGDWADHLRGAAKMLGEKYRLKVGLSGIIEGSLPIGGLSSSASVIICFLSALCKVNGIHLEPMEMILTAKAAENQYVGVSCGKLDQSCEVLSKKDQLLYLDTKDDSYELIPTSEKIMFYRSCIRLQLD